MHVKYLTQYLALSEASKLVGIIVITINHYHHDLHDNLKM